jgi:hypothetical protein
MAFASVPVVATFATARRVVGVVPKKPTVEVVAVPSRTVVFALKSAINAVPHATVDEPSVKLLVVGIKLALGLTRAKPKVPVVIFAASKPLAIMAFVIKLLGILAAGIEPVVSLLASKMTVEPKFVTLKVVTFKVVTVSVVMCAV